MMPDRRGERNHEATIKEKKINEIHVTNILTTVFRKTQQMDGPCERS